jgi:CheY-like chemotaxis protein
LTTHERHLASILIVEDDKAIRDELAETLRSEGYKIAVASNGAHALAWLQKGLAPTVILLDLAMPVMDGWQFRAKQLEDPRYASIPVVLLTDVGRAGEAVEALHAAGCMRKPFAVDPLLDILDHCNPSRSTPVHAAAGC